MNSKLKDPVQGLHTIKRSKSGHIGELLMEIMQANGGVSSQIESLCVEINSAYLDYMALRGKGWGYENTHKALLSGLELLAQTLEKRSGRQRMLIDLLRRELQIDDESKPGYFPPAASFGEPITVSYEPSPPLLRIEMEGMLPFSLNKGACYLHEKLRAHLDGYHKQWKEKNGEYIALFPAAVVFAHHYDKTNAGLNYVRDYDNQERKCIINTLQAARIMSDSPIRMVDMNLAVRDERTFTEILVTKVEHLNWLMEKLDFSLYTG